MSFEKPQSEENKPEENKSEEKKYFKDTGRIKSALEAQNKIGELDIEVGDKIISESGTERTVEGFKLDTLQPGGGYFDVITKKKGTEFKEQITFQQILDSQEKGIITIKKQ